MSDHDREPPRSVCGVVIEGEVVHGDQRGTGLGFPTANVELQPGFKIGYGVYSGLVDGRPAAISIGNRPTFGHNLEPKLEAHLLDFEGDLYGRTIHIELVEQIRAELKFDNVAELVERMSEDVLAVRASLERAGRLNPPR